MSYIDDNLKENERVVYRTKLHWAMLLGPGTLMVIGGLSIPAKGCPGLLFWYWFCVGHLVFHKFSNL